MTDGTGGGRNERPTARTAPPASGAARRDRARRLADELASLTGCCVRSVKSGGLPRELLDQAVPAPEVLLREYGSDLEPRTHNALCQHQPGGSGEIWTVRRLLEIRGFGLYCLLDLLGIMARHRAAYPATTAAQRPGPSGRLRE